MNTEQLRLFREKLREIQIWTGGRFRGDEGCCGLTLSQCHTLLEIGKRGEVSLVDLAASLGLDTSTLSRTIYGLVLLGLVNRATNPNDRRYASISLTEQGKKGYADIEVSFNDYFLKIFELIPQGQHESILRDIAVVADAVKRYHKAVECCETDSPAETRKKEGEPG